MNHQEIYKLLKTVKKNIRCPQCGKQYDLSQIKIRGITESVIFLELSCRDHMPVLATVAMTGKNVQADNADVIINNNDVIETYKFLEKFSGGFDKLFKLKN